MNKFYIFFFYFSFFATQAQAFKIEYERFSNDKRIENQDPIVVLANKDYSMLTSNSIQEGVAKYPFEQTLVHQPSISYWQKAQLSAKKSVSMKDSLSIGNQNLTIKTDRKKILGYWCTKAVTEVNSNKIELWFTQDLKVKGAPTLIGQSLGLVLEMTRNNNFTLRASKIESIKTFDINKNIFEQNNVDLLTYRDLIWNARFTTLPIFMSERIHFSDQAKGQNKTLKYANGTIALKKVDFPVMNANTHVLIDLTTKSLGDAYDRTGSVFMIPEEKIQSFKNGLDLGADELPEYTNGNGKKYQGIIATSNYNPPIEFMRFFTPFGVGQFNHIQLKGKTWQNEVSYRQDISEFVNYLSGKSIWVGIFIGNYDAGGHEVTLNATIHEGELNHFATQQIIPLFQTTNVMEMAGQNYSTMFDHEKGLEVTITLQKPMKNATLRFISTGHGGWLNGDEFLPKENKIFHNQNLVHSFIPWRTDCGSYRLFNPASGNFNNGMSSSDYSRSNWCPGTLTNPIYIPLGNLEAGTHTFKVQIPQGATEGGSFSAWNVSGVLLGE